MDYCAVVYSTVFLITLMWHETILKCSLLVLLGAHPSQLCNINITYFSFVGQYVHRAKALPLLAGQSPGMICFPSWQTLNVYYYFFYSNFKKKLAKNMLHYNKVYISIQKCAQVFKSEQEYAKVYQSMQK